MVSRWLPLADGGYTPSGRDSAQKRYSSSDLPAELRASDPQTRPLHLLPSCSFPSELQLLPGNQLQPPLHQLRPQPLVRLHLLCLGSLRRSPAPICGPCCCQGSFLKFRFDHNPPLLWMLNSDQNKEGSWRDPNLSFHLPLLTLLSLSLCTCCSPSALCWTLLS